MNSSRILPTLSRTACYMFKRPTLPSRTCLPLFAAVRTLTTTHSLCSAKPGKPPIRKAPEMVKLIDSHDNMMGDRPLQDAHAYAKAKGMELYEMPKSAFPRSDIRVFKVMTRHELARMEKENISKTASVAATLDKDSDDEKPSSGKPTPWKTKSVKHHAPVIKMITCTSRAADHDLELKGKQIRQWSAEGHEVRVTISGNNTTERQFDNVMERMIKHLAGNERVVQKVHKDNSLKFQVLPPKSIEIGVKDTSKAGQPATSENDQPVEGSEKSDSFLDEDLKHELDELTGSKK